MTSWREKVDALTKALGRRPDLGELLALNHGHEMSEEEIEQQRQSWVRDMTTPCVHGELDFEQCSKCKG